MFYAIHPCGDYLSFHTSCQLCTGYHSFCVCILGLLFVLREGRSACRLCGRALGQLEPTLVMFFFSPNLIVTVWAIHKFSLFQDELTTVNVKHGFTTLPQLSDEFGTARNCNITASKVSKTKSGYCIFIILAHCSQHSITDNM